MLAGTHRIVPVSVQEHVDRVKSAVKSGRIIIETRTPGDDRPAYRDFVTGKPELKFRWKREARGPYGWSDHDGSCHRTRAAMRSANIEIKRREAKAGGP